MGSAFSPKRKEVPVSFSVETPEMAKSMIESKGLSVPFVLTLRPKLWKNYPYPTLALGKLIGGLVNGFEMKIDGEFKETLSTLLQETEGIRPENLIERNGELILRKMTLQTDALENPWEYQSFRIVNESA